MSRTFGVTLDLIKHEIDNSRPLIALVHYGSLAMKFDQKYQKGHWVCIVGYNANEIVYHDPYWPDQRGAYVHLDQALFVKAMGDCALDGNTPNQALLRIA